MRRRRSSGRLRPIAILRDGSDGWPPGRAPAQASGQTFANPVINDFEIAPAGSLEWEILDRLAATGQYDPGTCSAWRG